jgi:hypothetical protein
MDQNEGIACMGLLNFNKEACCLVDANIFEVGVRERGPEVTANFAGFDMSLLVYQQECVVCISII